MYRGAYCITLSKFILKMNFDEFREYCVRKKGVSEDMPFDDLTLVFKVGGKMFALVSMNESPCSINLKCDPERSVILREKYESITPGYHMNKKHWNTVLVDGSVSSKQLKEWIDDSFALVRQKKRSY